MGFLCAVGGAGLWGLSFVIPLFLPGISPWDVSLGRYLVYGAIGATLLWRQHAHGLRLARSDWAYAFLFAATGYYGCYTMLVYAIEYAGPALPTLVMGLMPVSVAVAGNLRRREVPFLRLVGPLCAIGFGLAAVNLARHGDTLSLHNFEIGFAFSLLALLLLTCFLVANLLFLKRRPQVTPLLWANAIGATLLALSLLGLVVRLAYSRALPWEGTPTTPLNYLLASLVLGLAVSWLGGVLWNRASATLPAALVGQCIVFWPLSGIIYAYMLQGAWPRPAEAGGMVLVFAGVLWGLRAFRPRKK